LPGLAKAQDNYERQCTADRKVLSDAQRKKLFSLVKDFPAIWNDPETPQREQKQGRKTPEPIIALIDELLARHTDGEIAGQLNERGCATGAGEKFSKESVRWIRLSRGLKIYSMVRARQGGTRKRKSAVEFL